MSIPYSIFPGLKPSQSYLMPQLPVRSPKWNFKETMQWNNFKQQAVNGRVVVTKYWPSPLLEWEWTYGYLKDNPNDLNPFYTVPIPATDFEVLKGFYAGMQGGGNIFAYQPPDSVRGGSFAAASVSALVNGLAVIKTNGATSLLQLRLGDVLHSSGFGTATWLNGTNGTVVAVNYATNTFTMAVTTGGTHALVSDTGTLVGGQPLLAPDANNNTELVSTIGSYPTTISGTPTVNLVAEAVQLIDLASLTVYGNGTSVGGTFTLAGPSTIAPYLGYVLPFTSPPTLPLTASFTRYYPCRFSADTQEYENWLAMIWLCSSVKFKQERF